MKRLALIVLAALVVCAALASSASAHAYLVKTSPAASRILDTPPKQVALTYDEAVEPRFAIISVTNAAGRQETTGPVSRSPSAPTRARLRSSRCPTYPPPPSRRSC